MVAAFNSDFRIQWDLGVYLSPLVQYTILIFLFDMYYCLKNKKRQSYCINKNITELPVPGRLFQSARVGQCRVRKKWRHLFSCAPPCGPHVASRPIIALALLHLTAAAPVPAWVPITCPACGCTSQMRLPVLDAHMVTHGSAPLAKAGGCGRWIPLQHVQHLSIFATPI
jgi:hypothetical protein